MVARLVDLYDQLRQCHSFNVRDFLEVIPKSVFKADAGLVSINDDGTFEQLRISLGRPHTADFGMASEE